MEKQDGGIDEHPNQIGSINVSPNPITNQTTIKLSLPETNIIDNAISIFYNQGKIVDEIKIGTNPKIIWDRGNLPSGIYFMAIKTKNGNLSKKFIIL
ncbi:MAG: T9SS type A sorting domain-containing protein [Chlorobi bacterium]|nr:T9SS type A sorting domain-containing protein [Chlorobiota bacterium]